MKHLGLLLNATISLIVGATASAQQVPLAITDVTVIDGTGSAARPRMTVVIGGGKIIAVDSMSRAMIPAQAHAIDGRGKFLIPGLWDMHVHLAKAGASSLGLFIANGVTSVRDMGGDLAVVQRWRTEIDGGTRVGPRIRTAGPMLEHGLADEVVLAVYPILLGTGKRVFAERTRARSFELVSTQAFASGIIFTTYKFVGPLKTA